MKNFNYQQRIDDVQTEIEKVQRCFFDIWTHQIKENFTIDEKNFRIEEYVDVYGGFWLNKEEFNRIDVKLKKFYLQRINLDKEKIFLRGYDYYYVDPLVHINNDKNNVNDMLRLLKNKCASYEQDYEFAFLKSDSLSFENWVALIGFLEYILNDISSIQWFIYWEKKAWNKETANVLSRLSKSAELIGKSIALLLSFKYKSTYGVLNRRLEKVFQNVNYAISHVLEMGTNDWTSVRAIREGDSIALIYGVYIIKLSKFFSEKLIKKGILLSNSFGAMNAGIILKYLLQENEGVILDSQNVLYMQNRAEEDCIYSHNHLGCSILGKWSGEQYSEIIVVDDSIFTGNSFLHIKEYVKNIGMCKDMVHLLPMTVNCDCLKYCRRGISDNEDISDIVRRVIEYSRNLGDCLPPFTSFWDFSRTAPENNISTENNEVKIVLNGDDGLMKHIWARFEKDILKHGE